MSANRFKLADEARVAGVEEKAFAGGRAVKNFSKQLSKSAWKDAVDAHSDLQACNRSFGQ
jgi:hypothetical protein